MALWCTLSALNDRNWLPLVSHGCSKCPSDSAKTFLLKIIQLLNYNVKKEV